MAGASHILDVRVATRHRVVGISRDVNERHMIRADQAAQAVADFGAAPQVHTRQREDIRWLLGRTVDDGDVQVAGRRLWGLGRSGRRFRVGLRHPREIDVVFGRAPGRG